MGAGSLGDLLITMSADTAKWQGDMGKIVQTTQSGIQEIAKSCDSVRSNFDDIRKALASAFFVEELKQFYDSTVELAVQTEKTAEKIGMSVEALSELKFAAMMSDVSTEQLSNGMEKLAKNMLAALGGSTKQAAAFTALGISASQLKDGMEHPEEILGKIADQFQTLPNDATKTALAILLFGKSGAEMIPILNLGSAGISQFSAQARGLGDVINDRLAKQAEELNQNLKLLKASSAGLGLSIATDLLPPINLIIEKFKEVASIDLFKNAIEGAKKAAIAIPGLTGPVALLMAGHAMNQQDASKVTMPMPPRGGPSDALQKYLDSLNASKTSSAADPNANYANLVHAAEQKALQFEKAYEEERATVIKNANALEELMNQNAYDTGLTDLETYLNKKQSLNEDALAAEVAAKQKELEKAQANKATAGAAYDKDPTGNTAANYNDSLTKVAQATKALEDAESKLALARIKDADDFVKITTDTIRGYKEQEAAFMDMQGNFVAAAAVRKQLDEESEGRQKLIAQAMAGDVDAQKAYWAAEAKAATDAIKAMQDQANKLSGTQNQTASIINSTPNAWGGTTSAQQDAQAKADYLRLQQELTDKMQLEESFNGQMSKKYLDYLALRHAYEVQYAAETVATENQRQNEMLTGLGSLLTNMSSMLDKGNKEQFEIGKAFAIASALINTYQAASKALAQGGMMGGVMAAIAVAQGMMQVANIEAQQYKGREFGGPVTAGESYIVGEKRPELFTPGVSGMITPYVPSKQGVNVNLINYGTSKAYDVQLNEGDVRIIARDEARNVVADRTPKLIANEIADPNSHVSKALTRSTQTTRRRSI